MANSNSSRLLEWALGTFHTAFFFAVLALLLFLTGSLGNLLALLNTLIGVALYLALWLITYFCTVQAARRILKPLAPGATGLRGISLLRVLRYGILWGALDGLFFFLILFAIGANLFAVLAVIDSGIAGLFFVNSSAFLVFSLGLPIALAIGAAVGIVLSLLDSLLLLPAGYLLKG